MESQTHKDGGSADGERLPLDPHVTQVLVERVRQGDRAQLESLYVRVLPALYGWARVRIRNRLKDRIEPEDLIGEVWVRVIAGFERFDPLRSSFRAWTLGIAQNVLYEEMRKLGSGLPVQRGNSNSALLSDLPDSVTTQSRQLARDELVQRFLAHLSGLDETDRDIIIKHGMEEKRLAEVALQVGLSVDAATKRWQRLKEKLREHGIGHDLVSFL